MATATSEMAPVAHAVQRDLRIYSHSPLLYWWPVWAVAFLMALWTWLDNYHMVLVPENAVIPLTLPSPPGGEGRPVAVTPGDGLQEPFVHMARSRWPGTIFVATFLFVLVCSHAWLRGPWALFITACLVALIFLTSWLNWWGPLFEWFHLLRIYINLGGYLVIATVLFIVWGLTVFLFDRRTYLVFTLGQVRFRDELGDQEKVFDTHTIAFEKRQYDWFRWLVGFGAGDMIMRVGGPHPQVIELPNVVQVGKWLHAMEERLRIRDVV
jgi:hypothetical protein